MISSDKYLALNNNTVATTKRRTRSSINQHKIVIKDLDHEKQEISCTFGGRSSMMIVYTKENEIINIKCFESECAAFCEHAEVLAHFISKQTINFVSVSSKKRKNDFDEDVEDYVKPAKIKRQKTEMINDENTSAVVNVIKITKKKKGTVYLTEKQLSEITEVESILSIPNLLKSFNRRGSYDEFHEHCTKVLSENTNLIRKANMLTIEQADTDLWFSLRLGRVTASRLHETTRCTSKNGSLIEKYLGKTSGWSFFMMRGTVLEDYVFKEVKKEYPTLERCGLIMSADKSLFAASPDGLHSDFVLEIKCPGTANTFQQYTDLNKLNKKYFAQIQLQMFVTGKKKALLAVAALDFESTRNITKLWIPYDEDYVEQMTEDASEFYKEAIFPALMKKFLRQPKK